MKIVELSLKDGKNLKLLRSCLSPQKIEILKEIINKQTISLTELSRNLNIDRATISKSLDILDALGLIETSYDRAARIVKIIATGINLSFN